jgi:small conductance mechanosensitive channel
VLKSFSAVLLFAIAFSCAVPSLELLAQPAPPGAQAKASEVKLHETLVFSLSMDLPNQTAAQRARAAAHALERAFDAGFNEVKVVNSADVKVVFAGDVPVIELHDGDASAAQSASLDVYAAHVATQMRAAIQAERRRSDIAGTVFSISLVVFFGFVALVGSRRLSELARRSRDAIMEKPERIVPIRFNKLEVLGADSLRALLLAAVIIGRWVLQVGVIYIWLVLSLSRFEITRPYTDRLNHSLIEPLSALAQRALGALPVFVLMFALAAVVFVAVRIVELFFKGATREHFIWVPRELVGAVSALIRVAIVVLAVIFAGPIASGDPEGVLARLGSCVLLGVSLALTPLFCSAACGGVMIFTRRLQVGRQIELGSLQGRVVNIRLLDVVLRDGEGSEIRVPHVRALFTPLRVLGSERRSVELAVSPKVEPAAIIELFTATLGASSTGAELLVELVHIDADAARYRVSVFGRDTRSASDLRLLLVGALTREEIPLGRSSWQPPASVRAANG